MKLVLISDTHDQLDVLIRRNEIPDGDILIHAGDATYNGREKELRKLNSEFGLLKDKFKHILMGPGNHDLTFQDAPRFARALVKNATILVDESITIDGVKFYFSPWQPWFYDWAFNFPQNDGGQMAVQTWNKIPDDTDVLVTHGPPKGILDLVERGENVGCPHLLNRILNLPDLKLHVFGHIHAGYGMAEKYDKTFVNASICTEEYRPFNMPIIFEI